MRIWLELAPLDREKQLLSSNLYVRCIIPNVWWACSTILS
jgi:hypothetical protein